MLVRPEPPNGKLTLLVLMGYGILCKLIHLADFLPDIVKKVSLVSENILLSKITDSNKDIRTSRWKVIKKYFQK